MYDEGWTARGQCMSEVVHAIAAIQKLLSKLLSREDLPLDRLNLGKSARDGLDRAQAPLDSLT